jgi:hypothetical protein
MISLAQALIEFEREGEAALHQSGAPVSTIRGRSEHS